MEPTTPGERCNPTNAEALVGLEQGCGRMSALLFARKGYNVVVAAR